MLLELHIEDLGLIQRLDVMFGPGLTVLTGETGAGKTMLVEAINLLVGERADPGRVRAGAAEARVEGRFVIGDDEWVIARVVPAEGRSRAYVNGRLATVGQLGELGTRLVDIHGQHAHQSLLSPAVQRAALDAFAGTDLTALREARGELANIEASLAVVGGDTRARMRETDLLRFQVEEISSAGILSANEDEDLRREEDLLADATALRDAAGRALQSLVEDGGAAESLAAAMAHLAHRQPFADAYRRLVGLGAEISELARDIRALGESCEDDPERLEQIRGRRQLLRDLQRKYGDDLEQVLAFASEAAARLEELESFEARVAELEEKRSLVRAAEAEAAALVARIRRGAAGDLARAISAHLPDLALDKARLEVEVSGDDPADEIRLLFTANPGMPLAPLSKVASGGELARTMLAIRLVLAQGPPILVFDEVDAGIGGAVANSLAASLAKLGRTHQVLVVTHLAQVAAAADRHIVV
ncbi:MAG: DNA repair protein RecN, partial [Ilumatobacteraceae bacterium]